QTCCSANERLNGSHCHATAIIYRKVQFEDASWNVVDCIPADCQTTLQGASCSAELCRPPKRGNHLKVEHKSLETTHSETYRVRVPSPSPRRWTTRLQEQWCA
ncbi:hypothetical protein Tcan_00847, partial [Toxocara canis]